MKNSLLKMSTLKLYLIGFFLLFSLYAYGMIVPTTGSEFLQVCPMSHIMLAKKSATRKQQLDDLETYTACLAVASTAFHGALELWISKLDLNPEVAKCYYEYYDMEHFRNGQISDLLIKYLQRNPETRQYIISGIMAAAVIKYYPLPNKCYKHLTSEEIYWNLIHSVPRSSFNNKK